MAKASILWLVGEYCSLVPKMGPDVLRKAAKNFVNEVHPLFNYPSLATSFLLLPSPLFLLLSLLLFFSLIRSFVPFLLPLPPLSSPSPSLHLSPSSPSPQKSDIVKLQTVNLAAKLVLSNPKQTRLLCDYVLSLAKYDQNYDIRDRARFLKQLVTPSEVGKISDGGIFASSPLFLWARTFV